MFTKKFRFFGLTLHPQWLAQTSKKLEKWPQSFKGVCFLIIFIQKLKIKN
jgi:hypothetical protein